MQDNHLRIKTDEKRQILVVDDELINRELLNMALSENYSVIFAVNGQEALDKISGNVQTLSLILLDLLMPVMTGMEVLRVLRDTPELSRIPVIVMTADHESEVASLELGAMDFIPKPYPQQDVILARIRRIIELSEDRQIIHSTEKDALTELYNREYFYSYAETFDQHHKEDPMDAIIMDINHFHLINERFGRLYADQVLQQIGWNLREMVQDSGGIVCRREADTFMIYCPHREDYPRILDIAAAGLVDNGDSSNRIRLRLGVYPNVDKSLGMEQRFDRAKTAADTVRNNYNQNIAVYDAELLEREMFAEQLTEDFGRAIREKQFIVYYQPKFDIRPELPILFSAEALIRWQHPDLGLVSPGVFIPLFEKNGMIQRLDQYVWEEAAAQIRAWKDSFGITIPVSVNVSRIDMSDPEIAGTFRRLLDDHGLEPEDLILEITESAYAEDEEFIISAVNALRNMGLQVEMDDFGTGYSSLGMISQLPIDALKLDMIFVRNAFVGHGDMKMIELIIDIAGYLRVPVIAEGVETKEQVDVLKEMGCDIIQGYYFSKPVPPSEFKAFIAEKKAMLERDGSFSGQNDPEAMAQAEAVIRDTITYARISQALAQDYFTVYYINTKTGEYIEYSMRGEDHRLFPVNTGDNFFGDCMRQIPERIIPEDRNRVMAAFDEKNLLRSIRSNRKFSIKYQVLVNGNPMNVNVKALRLLDDSDHILIGMSNIDAEVEREKAYQDALEKSITYARISEALAADYFSIYYVDTITDHFIEFSSHEEYDSLNIEKVGEHFFETSRENAMRVMYQEDMQEFLSVFTRENLMKELDRNGTFTLSYRLVFEGRPTWVSMKATRMMDPQDPHIVIGVNNIDTQMRREQEYEKDLEDAIYAAMRDPLTGVKSKHAFIETEQDFDLRIKEGAQPPFAVAVCDVNGLKEVNDTLGHKAGDQYIIEACRIICSQFKHSPVFRIGGDEFVAVLQGPDYVEREELAERLAKQNEIHAKTDEVVIACGLASWRQDKEESFGEVFSRADERMYQNKKILKNV